jgi:hypothetical protein
MSLAECMLARKYLLAEPTKLLFVLASQFAGSAAGDLPPAAST